MLSVSNQAGMYKVIDIAEYWHNKGILPGMVMEECAEVIQAINKYERWKKSGVEMEDDFERIKVEAGYNNAIANEMGDLLIILDAYAYINGISYRTMDDHIAEKLEMEKEV